jgi:cobalt-zinc-cadmium efflux system membrane fusion protein
MSRIMRYLTRGVFAIFLLAVLPASSQEHEEGVVHLSASEIEEFGIQLIPAAAGVIGPTIELAGEIVTNPDRFAHVVPRVSGVVSHVAAGVGARVQGGAVLATIDSRELSDLKSDYLATLERRELARTSFEREERLWKQEISSEREYLQARQAYAEARINARSAGLKLHALGFSEADLQALPMEPDASFTRFDIRAPFSGIVLDKHITLGESVDEKTAVFSVTDLRQVWAIFTIYQRDLQWIRQGQSVSIQDREQRSGRSSGDISYVSPVIDEVTRTASVRVVLDNAQGNWRPGMFVLGEVITTDRSAPVVIERSAVQSYEGSEIVFVHHGGEETSEEFHLRQVRTGESTEDLVEILSGVEPGEHVVTAGAFTLKTEIQKGEFESGHNH